MAAEFETGAVKFVGFSASLTFNLHPHHPTDDEHLKPSTLPVAGNSLDTLLYLSFVKLAAVYSHILFPTSSTD